MDVLATTHFYLKFVKSESIFPKDSVQRRCFKSVYNQSMRPVNGTYPTAYYRG